MDLPYTPSTLTLFWPKRLKELIRDIKNSRFFAKQKKRKTVTHFYSKNTEPLSDFKICIWLQARAHAF